MSSTPINNKNEKRNPDDSIKILIATDIHLGFEYNKKRGQQSEDSFITFEEILQYGKEYEVDFILLGGDLFHDTKPSQTAILRCMELLRKYCLGTKEIKIQFLSDPEVIFRHCAYKTVNYEDPNLNISMPIFSIHGNHDDPSFGAIGSMDLLSVSGLINYFGKWTDLTKINIPPLIIKKGETHIALYGLSYINDQRLSRLLRDFKIDMLRPTEITDCFNIFVLHQNRAKHDEYTYIPQNKLPKFLNLIIWGHEHECRITPEFIPDVEYFISQPGSSIATSLCEGESKPKHIGILTVNKMKFKLEKLKLQTVRPFIFDNLILKDEEIPKNYAERLSESIFKFIDNYIQNELMPKAALQLSGHPKQPILPLLRLRIFYNSDEEIFDEIKLTQKYCDEVANPMDIVIFRKQKNINKKSNSSNSLEDDFEDIAQVFNFDDDEKNWNKTVQGGIKNHFSLKENKDKLTVLTVNGLNEALNRFVNMGDLDAFKGIVNHQMNKTITLLETCEVDTSESIRNEIKNIRDKRIEEEKEDTMVDKMEIQTAFNNIKNQAECFEIDSDINLSDEDEKKNMIPKSKRSERSTRGRNGRNKTKEFTAKKISSKIDGIEKRKTKKQDQNILENYMESNLNLCQET
ncbi:double-strand break repair protein MRE11 [Apis mellifera]|uniref:Double-strand break repair protein n=1 Tax=Apis mellifera TaxID=7460 RepID=A0A7M7M497_APIME|nr:double-strand break repair protein MRE11 [Apis mellifera]|eukprot:XP_016767519.2 double-strand break repair protein MRE11 [Apis mellifera]